MLTSEEHLLQQVVDLGQTEQLGHLDLLDHLPGDALEAGQDQEDLAVAAARVVLAVVDVIFEVDLDLVAHGLDLAGVTDSTGICKGVAGE